MSLKYSSTTADYLVWSDAMKAHFLVCRKYGARMRACCIIALPLYHIGNGLPSSSAPQRATSPHLGREQAAGSRRTPGAAGLPYGTRAPLRRRNRRPLGAVSTAMTKAKAGIQQNGSCCYKMTETCAFENTLQRRRAPISEKPLIAMGRLWRGAGSAARKKQVSVIL